MSSLLTAMGVVGGSIRIFQLYQRKCTARTSSSQYSAGAGTGSTQEMFSCSKVMSGDVIESPSQSDPLRRLIEARLLLLPSGVDREAVVWTDRDEISLMIRTYTSVIESLLTGSIINIWV